MREGRQKRAKAGLLLVPEPQPTHTGFQDTSPARAAFRDGAASTIRAIGSSQGGSWLETVIRSGDHPDAARACAGEAGGIAAAQHRDLRQRRSTQAEGADLRAAPVRWFCCSLVG